MLVQLTGRGGAAAGVVPLDASAVPVVGRARPTDMAEVGPLINAFAMRGLMLPKTPEQLHRTFREFLLARDARGALVGCVALRVFTPELGEVSALAVAPAAHGRGVGRALVEALIEDARTLGLSTLVALTLEPGFFHRLGFRTVSRALFPEKEAADCAGCDRRDHCREITVARDIQEGDHEGIGARV